VAEFLTASAGPDISICSGKSAILTATGGSDYIWSPSTGLSCTSCPLSIVNSDSLITYNLSLITFSLTANSGFCTDDTTITVFVNPLPTITSSDVSICQGSMAILTASGASSYIWSPSTYLSSTTGSVVTSLPFTLSGVQGYSVTGTDVNNCTNTVLVNIYVNALPTIAVSSDITICNGSGTTLTASSTGGVALTYSWIPIEGLNNKTGSIVIASPTMQTYYQVNARMPIIAHQQRL